MVRVVVTNFQSLGSVELQLEGLTALVGPSDRGKSALVRAIQAALFNLPGEFFVRTGADSSQVTVEWDGHRVVWEKGGGKNQFTIDGVLHSKVGTKAPDVLKALGFRDEIIGARLTDDGPEGGKLMRPQVAEQFDEIYLLKEPGTFINEVLVKLSRLGVLQRASRQCSADLRYQKSLLKVRRGDLVEATLATEKLAGAPLLRSRLEGLVTLDGEVEELRDKVARIRHLISIRGKAQARLALSLPKIEPDRTATAQQALLEYRELLQAREEVDRRVLLAKLPKSLIPTHVALEGKEYAALVAKVGRWKKLVDAVGARTMREVAVGRALSVMGDAVKRLHRAVDALDQFKALTPVCPLCLQPWEAAHDRDQPEPDSRYQNV